MEQSKEQTTSSQPLTAQLAEQEQIQFDPGVVGNLQDDNDSSADVESLRDSATSLASSIYEYRNINGRQYQSSKTTEYWAPTDEKHIEGLDISHQVTQMLQDNKLFLSPIDKDPKKILDVGTGTGIWAIDVADVYPSATVIGFDISAVQPSWRPPNCSFQIDDCQLDWTFPEDHFDFIHMRYLYGAIGDWDRLYEQAFAHARPGGWVESTEIDLETRSENPNVGADDAHIFRKWRDLFWAAGDCIGKTFKIARGGQMEHKMRAAGFVDVHHRQWKVPIGGWPRHPRLKQIGYFNGHFIDQSLDGFAVFPIGEILGWTFDEVTALVDNMRKAIKEPKALPYYVVHTVYGRKPESGPAAAK